MRNAKVLLGATLFAVVLAGAMLAMSGPAVSAPDQKEAAAGNHWRHHDGHWSYWDDGDQCWYYTDGTNWFYNNGSAWNVYNFDKKFGQNGFEKGDYKAPAEGAKIDAPRHATYRAPAKK
jgi:hypothetical protein